MVVILDRLLTKDKLSCWGCAFDSPCVFCKAAGESRQHLFFEYHYSVAVWNSLLHSLKCQRAHAGFAAESSNVKLSTRCFEGNLLGLNF